jgi:hypothetical protein
MGSFAEFECQLRSAPPAAVAIVFPYVCRKGELNGRLLELTKRYPLISFIAAFDSKPICWRDPWVLGSWGVSEVMLSEADAGEIRAKLDEVSSGAILRMVRTWIPSHTSLIARLLLEDAATTAAEAGGVAELARRRHVSEREPCFDNSNRPNCLSRAQSCASSEHSGQPTYSALRGERSTT